VRLLWTQTTSAPLRGLALARERGWVLAWDSAHCLYLFNRTGKLQAQLQAPAALTAACCADDGASYAAVGTQGQVWLLAPDLMPRWERLLPTGGVAAALDPLGNYLAASDSAGALHLFDRSGRSVWRTGNPRPLRYLAFVPEKPVLLGSADYGLVACFDRNGLCVWRDGLVAHIGSLTVSGDGSTIALACFSDGLCCYGLDGGRKKRLALTGACRLAVLSYDGRLLLTTGLENRVELRDGDGHVGRVYALDGPAVALALDALGENPVVGLAEGRILGLGPR
jgi:hypothetical protein